MVVRCAGTYSRRRPMLRTLPLALSAAADRFVGGGHSRPHPPPRRLRRNNAASMRHSAGSIASAPCSTESVPITRTRSAAISAGRATTIRVITTRAITIRTMTAGMRRITTPIAITATIRAIRSARCRATTRSIVGRTVAIIASVNDGTTGLIIGAAGGGILGNVIDGGRNRVRRHADRRRAWCTAGQVG